MVRHPGYTQCFACELRHYEALRSLATGEPPKECSECHTPWEEFRARGENKMIIHMEAGRYKFMCPACNKVYLPKRKELYGPTEFGWKNGLK
jgi:hypothetical protein